MYSFDPAINYGPNDAGVSALSIVLVSLGVVMTLSLFAAAYGSIANFFNRNLEPTEVLKEKTIVIVGDILHSRVARSNLWALTGCGANVILCGPKSLLPKDFSNFVNSAGSYSKSES